MGGQEFVAPLKKKIYLKKKIEIKT